MDPFQKPTVSPISTGFKNLEIYRGTNPLRGGLNYNINKDWSVYGGVCQFRKDLTKISSYGPEAGFSYHPSSCKIF